MASLLEAAASLAVSAAIFGLMTAAMSAQVGLQASLQVLAGELFAARQLEQLADRAVLAAGAGPALPPAIALLDAENVVLASDANGDRSVATNSAETTALELRNGPDLARVRIRFGGQTMTVLEAPDVAATFEATDRHGAAAGAETATLLTLRLEPAGDGPVRRLLFALPQRTVP